MAFIAQKDAALNQKDVALKEKDAAYAALEKGTLFTTLDQLFKSQYQSFQDHLESFIREHHVGYDDKNRYQKTVEVAGKGVKGAADSSGRSTSTKGVLDIYIRSKRCGRGVGSFTTTRIALCIILVSARSMGSLHGRS